MLPLIILALLPLASCWGYLGHRTVAYLAQLHLTPNAEAWVETLLSGQDISSGAVWPDDIARNASYKYTKPWHYIDARDDPPFNCTLNITRDCVGNCIVSALVNHTARVNDLALPLGDRGDSLRFVMHFLGDIHQPLHTEYKAAGGNGINVTFDGVEMNLHSVWDSAIPKKYIGIANETVGARTWAARLFNRTELRECTVDAKTCALEWAGEANQLVCTYVLKNGVPKRDIDLGKDYYEGAIPIVDMQVQRAGRRLAAWINKLAEHPLQDQPLLQIQ